MERLYKMSDSVWKFGPGEDAQVYGMPSRRQQLFLNGVAVGEIEVHAHRRAGTDKIEDLSWGVTAITYGPLTKVGEPKRRRKINAPPTTTPTT